MIWECYAFSFRCGPGKAQTIEGTARNEEANWILSWGLSLLNWTFFSEKGFCAFSALSHSLARLLSIPSPAFSVFESILRSLNWLFKHMLKGCWLIPLNKFIREAEKRPARERLGKIQMRLADCIASSWQAFSIVIILYRDIKHGSAAFSLPYAFLLLCCLHPKEDEALLKAIFVDDEWGVDGQQLKVTNIASRSLYYVTNDSYNEVSTWNINQAKVAEQHRTFISDGSNFSPIKNSRRTSEHDNLHKLLFFCLLTRPLGALSDG